MARKIEVQIVGDAASLQRAFRNSSRGAKSFEHDIGRASRGAISAAVSFRGLGRAMAFSSAQFLGGAGIVYGIKSTISAAEKSQTVLAQTANAVKRSGNSWNAYGEQIKKAALAEANISGFDDEALLQTFSNLVRKTHDVNQALKLNALAADVARGRHISLEAAQQLVLKASLGMAGALRRVGIDARKGATGVQLIQMLTQKYSGSAKAYGLTAAGAQDRFRVAVENLQEAVGSGLLPTITRVLNPLSTWLNDSKNQERVQRDVSTAVKETASIVRRFSHDAKVAADAVGGFDDAIRILIGLKVGSTLWKWRAAMMAFSASSGTAGAAGAAGVLAKRLNALKAIGLVSIAFRFPGLAAGLEGLAAVPGAIAAAVAAAVVASSGSAPNVPALPKKGRGKQIVGLAESGKIPQSALIEAAIVAGIDKNTPAGTAFKNKQVMAYLDSWAVSHGLIGAPTKTGDVGLGSKGGKAGKGSIGGAAAGLDGLSKIQNAVASARLAAARKQPGAQGKLVAALKAQIDFDRHYEAIQQALVAKGGKDAKSHAKTLQGLYADETSALDEINSMQDKSLTSQERAAKKAATAAKKAAAAAKKRREAAARLATTFTVPMALLIAQARAGTTATKADDISVAKKIKAFAEATIKSNKKKGQALVDAWNEIASQMSVIGQKQTNTGRSVIASAGLLTANLGLSLAQRKALEARYSQAQAHSGHIPVGHAVAGQTIDLHSHVYLNGHKIAEAVTTHQQRAGKHSATQSRGPNAGRNPRVH